MRSILLAVTLMGCGDNSPATMATGDHHAYILRSESVPLTEDDATADGIPLGNAGHVTNQLGSALGFIARNLHGDLDVTHATSAAVADGTIVTRFDLQTTDFTDADEVGVAIDDGPALLGTISDGALVVGPGAAAVRIGWPGMPPIRIPLVGAEVRVTAASPDKLTGILAGAIAQADFAATVMPAFESTAARLVARDCHPAVCGCDAGSTGELLIDVFDANHDCAISTAEIRENNFMMSLITPDVTVDGKPALSFGVAFDASAI